MGCFYTMPCDFFKWYIFYYFESPHRQITESFDARVNRVIDGDTIEVEIRRTFAVRLVDPRGKFNVAEKNTDKLIVLLFPELIK